MWLNLLESILILKLGARFRRKAMLQYLNNGCSLAFRKLDSGLCWEQIMRKISLVVFSLFCFIVGANQTLDAQVKNKPGPYERYADGILKVYDEDQDSQLSKAEIDKMRRPVPMSADSDSDGKISMNELIEHVRDKTGEKRGLGNVKVGKSAPVFVQLDLFEASKDGEVDELKKIAVKLNDEDVDVQELISKLRENENVERTEFFSFQAQAGKEVELTEESAENNTICMFKTTVNRVEPSVEMSVNFQRSRPMKSEMGVASVEKKIDKPKQNNSRVNPTRQELEEMILAKVRERQNKSHRKSNSQRSSDIKLGATVDCGSNGVTTFHFANGDQHYLMVIRAKAVK